MSVLIEGGEEGGAYLTDVDGHCGCGGWSVKVCSGEGCNFELD